MSQNLPAFLVLSSLMGCDLLGALSEPPKAPEANLVGVDLVASPSIDQLSGYSCYTYLNDDFVCGTLLGLRRVAKKKLLFGFDAVFDLSNPNTAYPIPLTELLIGVTVFDDTQLGSVCVTFCDSEDPLCDPERPNPLACQVDETTDLNGPLDLVPTIEDLIAITSDAIDGTLDENLKIRSIPRASYDVCFPDDAMCEEMTEDGVRMLCCDEECLELEDSCRLEFDPDGRPCSLCDGHTEAHIRFDLGIDPMIELLESFLLDAMDDLVSGRPITLSIPIQAEGTLFFEVPVLGRYGVGFGPFETTWNLP